MNKERLLKLATFLDALPEEKWAYHVWVRAASNLEHNLSCGTQACAIGWCGLVFPDEVTVKIVPDNICSTYSVAFYVDSIRDEKGWPIQLDGWNMARWFFDIDSEEVDALFVDDYRDGDHSFTPNPREVADKIRDFVGVD